MSFKQKNNYKQLDTCGNCKCSYSISYISRLYPGVKKSALVCNHQNQNAPSEEEIKQKLSSSIYYSADFLVSAIGTCDKHTK